MKRKLIISLLALSLPLAGCSLEDLMFWKKKDDQDQKVDYKEINKNKLYDLMYEFGKDTFGVDDFSNTEKQYFATAAKEASDANVDAEKIKLFLNEFPNVVKDEDFLEIGSYFEKTQKENYLDDICYFLYDFGKCGLKVSYEEKHDPLLEKAIDIIDEEGDKLPQNLYSLVDEVVTTFSLATDPSFLSIASKTFSGEKVDVENLAKVFDKVPSIISAFTATKDNVVYLMSLLQSYAKSIMQYANIDRTNIEDVFTYTLVTEVLNINLSERFEIIYDVLDEMALTAKNMDQEFYRTVASYNNKLDAGIYTFVGLFESVVGDKVIPTTTLSNDIDSLIQFCKKISDACKDLEGYPTFVTTILDSVSTKNTLLNLSTFVIDILNTRLDSINAKSLTTIISALLTVEDISEIWGEIRCYDYDLLPKEIRDEVTLDEIVDHIHGDSDYFYHTHLEVIREPDENGDTEVVTYYFEAYYLDDLEVYLFEYSHEIRVFHNITPLVDVVYSFLNELISKRDLTDRLVDELLNVVAPAYTLFNEIKDNFDIEENYLDMIDTIVPLLNENSELAKKIVHDVLVLARDMLGAVAGENPDYNANDLYIGLMLDELEPGDFKYSETRLVGAKEILKDIYDVLNLMEMLDQFIAENPEFTGVTNKEEFVEVGFQSLLDGLDQMDLLEKDI